MGHAHAMPRDSGQMPLVGLAVLGPPYGVYARDRTNHELLTPAHRQGSAPAAGRRGKTLPLHDCI